MKDSLQHMPRINMKPNACTVLIFLAVAACQASSHDAARDRERPVLPAVYTRYLSVAVPAHGIVAEFNPPVLRWPVVKKHRITYDVRLSQDSLFPAEASWGILQSQWAMFNPHQRLEQGTWYWQHRESGGDWSLVANFVVTGESRDLVSPRADDFLSRIPRDHPRVLAEKGEVAGLQSLLDLPDAKGIIRQADAALTASILTEKDGKPNRHDTDEDRNKKFAQDASHALGSYLDDSVLPLCQAWMLSAENRDAYKQQAIRIALEVATWDPKGVSGSAFSDFTDGRCMLAMAVVYDTFHEQLSEGERSLLMRAIHQRAMNFYHEWVNNQEARLLSGHVWQHILHYFFQTALAMYGDDPDAADWLSYAYELFLARSPILGGTDGGWVEGASYFRMNMETLLDIPRVIKKYTGFDFVRQHPWYEKNISWLVYNVPPGSAADGFGDNTEEVNSPGAEYLAFAREMARQTGNRLASWYVRECQRYEHPNLANTKTLRWMRLTGTPELSVPEPAPGPTNMASVFRDIGVVSMHTNPGATREDLMVSLRSSPFGCYGHFLSDQNCFNILYGGEKTFFRTGYKVTMTDPHRTGWYQHTKSNNGILVNGAGEPYSTEAFGWIPRFLQGKDIAYAMGDASNAYSSRETGEDYGVTRFLRHLILLKPDVVVVYDELEAGKGVAWSWLIHSMEKILVDSTTNSFRSTFGDVTGLGKFWSSVPVGWSVADTFEVPAVNWRGSKTASGRLKSYDNGQWHLKATTRTATKKVRFLAVLRISPGDANIAGESTGSTVRVKAGRWRISAKVDPALPPGVVISDNSNTVAFATHGDAVDLAGRTFSGRGPSRLVQVSAGEASVTEARDELPHDLRQSLLYFTANQNPTP
jgi:hypothetical protein